MVRLLEDLRKKQSSLSKDRSDINALINKGTHSPKKRYEYSNISFCETFLLVLILFFFVNVIVNISRNCYKNISFIWTRLSHIRVYHVVYYTHAFY